MKVSVRKEKVMIPTYEIATYDKNPMFLEKRVYQGSSGKVYPHPVCEGVSDEKKDKEYQAIFLENEYILVMILPELGGRIQRIYDKTNGYDAIYYNEVIKPALVGLCGPWISGGIEFNWPQHHRPSTFDPVDYTIENGNDGSVTVWVGETEKMFHTKGMAGFCLYPDKAYLEIKGRVYNPTDRPQTFLWWANPAVAVNDDTQSVFPPDVTAVMDHGKRDVSKFPIADGIYYKVNYAPGTDISRYKNIPVPTSYMAYHSDYDFIGNYDHGKQAGLLHIADHHVSPGKKQWTWGNGDFGKAWDRNLTDENGPYIELMTGMFTDNQPDFTFLKPYEEKSFTQYFMPYKNIGAVKNATLDMFANVILLDEGVKIMLYAPCEQKNINLSLVYDGAEMFTDMTDVSPKKTYEIVVPAPRLNEEKIELIVKKDDAILLTYAPKKNQEEIPKAATPLPRPQEIETTEKLFLAATHLEQYRHATYSPEDYYLEGLQRDASDIRLNLGYGKYLYQKGLFVEAKPFIETAISSLTWKNPNPYDCEAYYVLGLILRKIGENDKAYDAFYKATWDSSMQDKAFYQLACLASQKNEYAQALDFVEKSLNKGVHHLKARTLKSCLLRRMQRLEEAELYVTESMHIDALDHGAFYEALLLGIYPEMDFDERLRSEEHNYIELALGYMNAGFVDEAEAILSRVYNVTPMSKYYLYRMTKQKDYLMQAENLPTDYCFPNRLEDIEVLQDAVDAGGMHAAYYLGNLYYDRGRYKDACTLWEMCCDKIKIPTAYRNLSFVYYNKQNEPQKAREVLEKAFHMDETDVRVFFELDQLYKVMNESLEFRLQNMEKYSQLLSRRDDLYTEYITLLNMNGEYQKAYDLMMNHKFHPWEGGEGKITTQYRYALIQMAENTDDLEAKSQYLLKALKYPYNLGEGKLIGNMDNDVFYLLGRCTNDTEKRKDFLNLAIRGENELGSAKYYNDQPPQMRYYATLAKKELGFDTKEDWQAFLDYASTHFNDEINIDYFAVSLPDFLVFEGDLKKNNQVHCYLMQALGYAGLEQYELAKEAINKGLVLQGCNQELRNLYRMISKNV